MFEILKVFVPISAMAVILVSVLYNNKITKQREQFCKEHKESTEALRKRVDAHDVVLATNAERFKTICRKLDGLEAHNDASGKWRGKYDTLFADIDRNLKFLVGKK